jgi:hypothetical protein
VVGLLERLISPVAKPLPTQDNLNTEETRIFMPRVGFEPMIPVFEREKTGHALDRAVAVIGTALLFTV